MDVAHFGLATEPFSSPPSGSAVFVGPAQAASIGRIHKALVPRDAVLVVSGPFGVGKTTIVNRALETMSPGRLAGWVGRIKVSPDEILELLLAGFGFKTQASSTLRRFAAFRRYLHERAASGVPVAIIVEDACKLGAGVLAEIEALTAADTADGGGANLVLMGDPGLDKLLTDPELVRLVQRIRCRETLEPYAEIEINGYLQHSIRVAGGDAHTLFATGARNIVVESTGGVPRMINTLCSAALADAAESGERVITAERMARTARQVLAYRRADPPAATTSAPDAVPARSPAAFAATTDLAAAGTRHDAGLPPSARDLVVESGRYPDDRNAAQAVDAASTSTPATGLSGDEIPGLIQDTQPGLDLAAEVRNSDRAPATKNANPKPAPVLRGTRDAPHIAPKDADREAMRDDPADDIWRPAAADSPPASGNGGSRPGGRTEERPGNTMLPPGFDAPPATVAENFGAIAGEPDTDDIPELIMDTQPGVNIKSEVESAKRAGTSVPQAQSNDAGRRPAERDDDDSFDLDAVLNPEAESTNLMPAVTSALEGSAAESGDSFPSAAGNGTGNSAARTDATDSASDTNPFSIEELPTLSDSLRIDALDDEPAAPDDIWGRHVPDGAVDSVLGDTASVPELASNTDFDDDFEKSLKEIVATAERELSVESPQSQSITDSADTGDVPVTNEFSPDDGERDDGSDIGALDEALQAANRGEFATDGNDLSESTGTGNEPTLSRRTAAADARMLPDREPDQFAETIGRAGSLEEISDVMAETLFGEEFAEISASAIASPEPAAHSAPDKDGCRAVIVNSDAPKAGNGAHRRSPSPGSGQSVPAGAGAESGSHVADGNGGVLRESVAMRIDVLNELKGTGNEADFAVGGETIEIGDDPADVRRGHGPQLEPIERQINTSMTQTLRALNVAKVASDVAAGKSDKKRGLLSRFRRS